MGRAAHQSARKHGLRSCLRRGQQRRPRRRRLSRHHGRSRYRAREISARQQQAGADGLQLRRRNGWFRRGQDRPLQGNHQRSTRHRSGKRVRHRERLLLRPLVLQRLSVGARRERVAAEPARQRSACQNAVPAAAGRERSHRSAGPEPGNVSRTATNGRTGGDGAVSA